MAEYPPISNENLEALCGVLGDTTQGLTGSAMSKLLDDAGIKDIEPTLTKRIRLFEALKAKQKEARCSNNVLDFIKRVMVPQRYVSNPEYYESFRGELNKALSFAGYKINKQGEIEILDKPATSLGEVVSDLPSKTKEEKSIFRVFISHSSKDVKYANFIKQYLSNNFKIDSFVAHSDIEPSKEWVDEILKTLMSKDCDIFIALITPNYKVSEWCNQEAGIAYCSKKLIFPIKLMLPGPEESALTKNGFLNKYQLLKWCAYETYERDQNAEAEYAKALLRAFYVQKIISFDQLIGSLETSYDWWDAAEKLSLILELDKTNQKLDDAALLSNSRAVRIIEISDNNQNIYNSWSARPNLKQIMEKYKEQIPHDIFDSLEKKINISTPNGGVL